MNSASTMSDFEHRVREVVRFSETDLMGHVNNTVFATYFEVGRSRYFSDQGIYEQARFGLVIVKTEIEFLGMIHWPGDVEIATCVTGARTSSFTTEQLLEQDGRSVGTASSTMVLIDTSTDKPTPIPDDIRAMLEL